MPDLAIQTIDDRDIDAVIALWERCGLTRPWNDPHADIALARSVPNATVLVGRQDGEIAASVMVGHDGHRGAVYYVAVDPARQGTGLGRAIMEAAESWLRDKGIGKLNLLIRGENADAQSFYARLGYVVEPNIQMARRLDP